MGDVEGSNIVGMGNRLLEYDKERNGMIRRGRAFAFRFSVLEQYVMRVEPQ